MGNYILENHAFELVQSVKIAKFRLKVSFNINNENKESIENGKKRYFLGGIRIKVIKRSFFFMDDSH